MIDNVIYHYTPEGTTLTLIPAGIVPRFWAWIVDLLIRGVLLLVCLFVAMSFDKAGIGLFFILYFLLDWFYAVFFEVYKNGQTIGKKRFGIRVCQDNGMAIGLQASMTRNILRIADFPFLFVSALFCMLFSHQSKRLGDMVAGTMVVYLPEPENRMDIPKADPVICDVPLLFDEQQAILAYAERLNDIPKQRRAELVQILSPITKTNSEQQGQKTLLGIANGIIGRG